jgi:hypothetical protein
MGDWWRVGISVGFGVGSGVLLAGLIGARRGAVALAVLLGAAAGVGIGFLVDNWDEAIGGAVGGIAGAVGAAQVVRGTLRRGGTRLGTAVLVAGAAVVLAALGLIPGVGYLEALVVPALAARLRRRSPETYAGLRTLARD